MSNRGEPAAGASGLWVSRRRPENVSDRTAVVVVIHGTMDRSAAFAKMARQLPDVEVVRYDRRGYGRSAGLEPAPGIEGQVADLLEVCGEQPVVLVGHSMGAVIALAAAQRQRSRVRAVVAFEPPLPWRDGWGEGDGGAGDAALAAAGRPGAGGEHTAEAAGRAAEAFLRRLLGDVRWEALPEPVRAARRAAGGALLADLRAARAGAAFEPGEVLVPVVVGCGSESAPRHRHAVEELAVELADVEVVTIEGAGHGAHVSHPEQFAALVRRGLARAAWPAGMGDDHAFAGYEPGGQEPNR